MLFCKTVKKQTNKQKNPQIKALVYNLRTITLYPIGLLCSEMYLTQSENKLQGALVLYGSVFGITPMFS